MEGYRIWYVLEFPKAHSPNRGVQKEYIWGHSKQKYLLWSLAESAVTCESDCVGPLLPSTLYLVPTSIKAYGILAILSNNYYSGSGRFRRMESKRSLIVCLIYCSNLIFIVYSRHMHESKYQFDETNLQRATMEVPCFLYIYGFHYISH